MIYIIAILIGFTIIVSMVQNARLEQEIDIRQVTLMNFITGGIGSALFFIISGESLLVFTGLEKMPLYGYIGGIIGVIAVTLGTVIMKHVSVINAAMLMYTGQLLAGILIDLLRGTELSTGKLIGCALIIIGVYFNSFVDTKQPALIQNTSS